MAQKYYLSPAVQVEPLVNRWYAYPYLINPATYGMVLRNYQLSVIKSYIQMPMAHAAALKDPNMVGGPFIDYGGKRVEEIRSLDRDMRAKTAELLAFSEGLVKLHELLKQQAIGLPMEPLYEQIPESVKRFVEIVYDVHQRGQIRLIEKLLYESELYNTSFQSFALVPRAGDSRSFIFSTPRLSDPDIVEIPIAFTDPRAETLMRLKNEPMTLDDIRATFGVNFSDEHLLKVLTADSPHSDPETVYTGTGVRIRYFGHACVLIQSKSVSILTDPLISYEYDTDLNRYSYKDLPPWIDYVVITHAHHDHVVLETLLQLRHRIGSIIVPRAAEGNLMDPSLKNVLERTGFNNVVEFSELDEMGSTAFNIMGLPFFGEHCDLDIRTKLTYRIQVENYSFLVTADSSCLNPAVYKFIAEKTGSCHALFIGMECTGAPLSWAYGPLLYDKIGKELDDVRRSNGSDSSKALKLAEIFSVQHVYLYAMGLEPWLNYFMALQHGHSENTNIEADKFLLACKNKGIEAESLYAQREMFFLESIDQSILAEAR
jgi:L-ascorbate metabolism protein UlaG (beta-lactamase superfamily)